ncbi:MAG: hypothetical protein LBM13_01615 [Candidatus Ancillula sp.]|jgi:hypothetical protein|nr:hypothetical protein [Candidatus Ancillula sp.]
MFIDYRYLIDRGFRLFIKGLKDYVDTIASSQKGENWPKWLFLFDKMSDEYRGNPINDKKDPRTLLKAILNPELHPIFTELGWNKYNFKQATQINKTRNKLAHFSPIIENRRSTTQFLLNVEALLNLANHHELAAQTRALLEEMDQTETKNLQNEVAEPEINNEITLELERTDDNVDVFSEIKSREDLDEFLREIYQKADQTYGRNSETFQTVRQFANIIREDYLRYYCELTDKDRFMIMRALRLFLSNEDLLANENEINDETVNKLDDAFILEFYAKKLSPIIEKYNKHLETPTFNL